MKSRHTPFSLAAVLIALATAVEFYAQWSLSHKDNNSQIVSYMFNLIFDEAMLQGSFGEVTQCSCG